MSTITEKTIQNVVVPSFIAMDKFVAWNAREVTALNPLAFAAWPFAQLAKLINKFVLSLFSSDIIKHQTTSNALKVKAALVLASQNKHQIVLQHIPIAIRNTIDEEIYNIAVAENANGAAHNVTDPLFGQHFRETTPADFRVIDAVNTVLGTL